MNRNNVEILKKGGIGVMATDTIYGLVGSALQERAVKRIIGPKQRVEGKGFITLISSLDDLKIFGIELTDNVKNILNKFWPGQVSVEFKHDDPRFSYLRRPEGCSAFRWPNKKDLLETLKQTGPLIAPSANPAGLSPAKNIAEAKAYFGDTVDFYEDAGDLNSPPSTLVRIVKDKVEILRQGVVIIPEN
jgi:L-threonylcarbamoyladenylate synthase